MELQELVERIERWKTKMAIGSGEVAGVSDEMSQYAAPDVIPVGAPLVDADELDFEEMDMAEIPNADSGIVEAEPIGEDTIGEDTETAIGAEDEMSFEELSDDFDDVKGV